MTLLFLSVIFPFPPTNGRHIRSLSVLRALADIGHEVHLLRYGSPKDTIPPGAAALCRTVTTVKQPASPSALGQGMARLRSLPSPVPYSIRRFCSRAMQTAVMDLLQRYAITAVICDSLDAFANIPTDAGIPIILNQHNVEHLIIWRYLEIERNLARRCYMRIELKKLRVWEKKACDKAQLVLACSRQDGALLQQLSPTSRVAVAPNVVNLDDYVPCAQEQDNCILYSGGMDWYPNQDAAAFFIREILPVVRTHIPDVTFVVAGRNPPTSFVKQFSSLRHVTFTGEVDRMQPLIASSAVCVAPLRMGSGTRLKILEAAAMGKPVVSTTLGAEGLAFDVHEICIADDPKEFALRVVELLRNPARRCSMGAAARRRVAAEYSSAVLRKAIEDALMHCRDAFHPGVPLPGMLSELRALGPTAPASDRLGG